MQDWYTFVFFTLFLFPVGVLFMQTCVLKVNIHCDGCKDKVRKILQKIDGNILSLFFFVLTTRRVAYFLFIYFSAK